MFLGLRTAIYPAPDLAAAKRWYARLLGLEPYFDEPFYVGFEVAGYELALDPAGDPAAGPVTYWGVEDADRALARLLAAGAAPREQVREVGGGIRVATALDPAGSVLGVIENPHFRLPGAVPAGPGPGR
ncbi:VOC family protein [Kineococcus sp. T13]|uniref:VOC family protein n=1 Tax=Kineococcus vitellinus TaxID=2696565 RepID=UPI001412C740|nr:VOC family protein [Kineococcus vitellinus]NAZ76142.1 VOC family protein [Kineococcus vitellinus]